MPEESQEETEIIVIMPSEPIEEDPEPSGPPGWMITFGDAVSLLLTFFVLLLSFSSFGPTDPARDTVVFNSVIGTGAYPQYSLIQDVDVEFDDTELNQLLSQRETEGGFELQEKHVREKLEEENNKNIELNVRKLEKLLDDEKEIGVESGGKYEVKMSKNKMGFVITFARGILFNEGKSSLKPTSYEELKLVSNLIKQMPNDIIVTGHARDTLGTDTMSRNTAEYLLSIARANKVAEYLMRIAEISPERITITGMGSHTEIESDDDDAPGQETHVTISVTGSFDGYMIKLKKQVLNHLKAQS